MPEILSIGELLDLGNSAATAGLIPYSALEYNGSGNISGISGSAIAGGVDTTIVSAIASSYVESGISGKVDQSAFDDCCSSVQSALSGKLDASASGQFAPSGDYVFNSAYSSFTGDTINNISSMSSIVSALTGDYLEKSASSMFAPSGDYALSADVSSTVDVVANNSASWGQGGADYSGISPVIVDNAERTIGVSSMPLDVDETMTSYVSGGVTYFGVNGSAVIHYSSIAGNNSAITSINGSAISASGSEFTGVLTDTTLTGNGLQDSALGVNGMTLIFDSSMNQTFSGNSSTVGVDVGSFMRVVGDSAEATAANILYIVTGSVLV